VLYMMITPYNYEKCIACRWGSLTGNLG
jgi:hypothetical protein